MPNRFNAVGMALFSYSGSSGLASRTGGLQRSLRSRTNLCDPSQGFRLAMVMDLHRSGHDESGCSDHNRGGKSNVTICNGQVRRDASCLRSHNQYQ